MDEERLEDLLLRWEELATRIEIRNVLGIGDLRCKSHSATTPEKLAE